MKNTAWENKISHHSQMGGIETSVLDNGPGRNTRIAWVNTGSGLRYKIVIDRGLDIVDAFYNQHSLAWISHGGIASPALTSDKKLEWLRTFAGGLMTTCGLSTMGAPEEDEFGSRGLHGRYSHTPAEVVSVIQPDPVKGEMNMSITARIKETTVFGPSVELKRTISGELGDPVIRVHDEVTNLGNKKIPHMILYHLNFGWPLLDEGTDILWKGRWKSRDSGMDRKIFNPKNNFRVSPAPLDQHSGTGESCGLIDPEPAKNGTCTAGLHNPKLNLAVAIRFQKDQLPCLTNWQHWGKGEYVTGIEPGTNFPLGQSVARKQGTLIFLDPGESRCYDLEMEVLNAKEKIAQLIRSTRGK